MKYSMIFIAGFMVSHLYGCGAGPKLRIYLSDPARNGMEYYDERTGDQGFVDYANTDKFIALDRADARTLMDYCGLGKTTRTAGEQESLGERE